MAQEKEVMKIHIKESDEYNDFKITKRVSVHNAGKILADLFLDATNHHARLGQELVNQDYVSGVFPTLFYCTEDREVIEWFYENIVINSKEFKNE